MSKKLSVFFTAASVFALTACGMMGMSGTYNVTQQGGQFQQNPACSQIMMNINQSGGQITGQGQNQCFSQTLQGTASANGQANVTLIVNSSMSGQTNWMPNNNWNTGSMGCTYQGMLIISGNTISGSLNPTGNCMGQGMITLNGNRI
ncbi:MAG: hypothetical protein KGP28_04340 [Bdellovibrionales bacterium]|nr:hypothetical protein [Bdellovibrionales bacterium]